MERYGYIRVSAKDQNPERQLFAMQEQQITKEKIYFPSKLFLCNASFLNKSGSPSRLTYPALPRNNFP